MHLHLYARKTGLALVFMLGVSHTFYAYRFGAGYQQSMHRNLDAMNAYENEKKDVCATEENSEGNTLFVSNWGYVFSIQCAARVQNMEPVNFRCEKSGSSFTGRAERCNTLVNGILNLSDRLAGSSIRAGVFPGRNGINTSDLPLPEVGVVSLQNSEWNIIQNNTSGLLLSYKLNSAKNSSHVLK